MKNLPNEAMTHAGRFHADDVFSAALLRILKPDITIIRRNKVPEGYDGLVFDLCGGEYDHHNENLLARDNGVPYASFGLLWKEYGAELVSKSAAEAFDESFIQPLDIQDNMGGNNQLARVITQANPTWDSGLESDACFFKAVDVATFILQNEIASMRSCENAKAIVGEALSKMEDDTVVLDVGVPWKGILIPSKAKYVVYPSARGGYNIQAVPIEIGSQECKLPFPAHWRGKNREELENIIGIPGVNFCHPGGYLMNTDTEEQAICICKLIVVPQN